MKASAKKLRILACVLLPLAAAAAFLWPRQGKEHRKRRTVRL